jgi:hypothetical protein
MEEFGGYAILIPILIPLAGMGIGALAVWTEYKSRRRALDVLQTYAERGAEPPAEVLQSLKSTLGGKAPAERVQSRGEAFGRAGLYLMLGLGLAIFSVYFQLRGSALLTTGLGIGSCALLGYALLNLFRGRSMPKTDVG